MVLLLKPLFLYIWEKVLELISFDDIHMLLFIAYLLIIKLFINCK